MAETKTAGLICCLMATMMAYAYAGGSVCAGTFCNNGQCISKSLVCNGNCDCGDCSDERRDTCPFYDGPSDQGYNSGGIGSGAIIGIVVGAICLLLLLIGILIVFLICRIRREALKNLRTRRAAHLDPSLDAAGCALPVDIPIEALAREPPPQYTPMADNSTSMSPSSGHQHFNISVLPPPYYAHETSPTIELSYALEAPPKYQSHKDLSCAGAGGGGGGTSNDYPKMSEAGKEAVEMRRQSVDSFVDAPSMSNILLTSSRSSVIGFESYHDGGARGSESRVHRSSVDVSGSDSACGGSLVSSATPERSSSVHTSGMSIGPRSRSMSSLLYSSVEIPQHGLQKYAATGSPGGATRSPGGAARNRSVPSMTVANNGTRSGVNLENGISDDQTDTNPKSKTHKYRKRADVPGNGAEAHQGGDHPAYSARPTELGHGGRLLKNKRQISQSLPQLGTLQEEVRWEDVGSCDV